MGQDGSGPEFHVNFGSGRVGSHQLWVGSRKLDPRPTLSCRPTSFGNQDIRTHQIRSCSARVKRTLFLAKSARTLTYFIL